MSGRYALDHGVMVALSIMACGIANAAAQDQAGWSLRPVGATMSDNGWIIMAPRKTVELEVVVANDEDSKNGLLLDAGFFRQLAVTMVHQPAGRVLDTEVRWRDLGFCAAVPNCPVDITMSLAPGDGASFVATVATMDGQPFAEGEYLLRVSSGNARERLLGADRSLWKGRVSDNTTVSITVREVRTVEDQRRLDQQEVGEALRRNDRTQALAIYQRIVARNPSDAGAYGGAGAMLSALGRFEEAARSFERSLALNSRASLVPQELALVYFILGEDSKASDLLRRYYVPAQVTAMEAEMRVAASKHRGAR